MTHYIPQPVRLGTATAGADMYTGSVDPSVAGQAATLSSLFFRLDTGDVYRKFGAGDTDWVALVAAPRINELWGPRPDAHPADDEFDQNAVAAKWLQTGFTGNLNFGVRPAPYAAPGVNAASWENLHGPDNSSAAALAQNSWLRIQPGGGFAGLWQPLDSALFGGAVPANLLVWMKMRFAWRNETGIAAGDYDCGLTFFEDVGGGINFARHVTMSLNNTSQGVAGAIKPMWAYNAGGGEVEVQQGAPQNDLVTNRTISMHSGYIAMQKIGDIYHAWLVNEGGKVYFGADTNGGFAAINALGFWCSTASGGASGGGIPIFDFDFFRVYQGADWIM